jgi:hypothetical protein
VRRLLRTWQAERFRQHCGREPVLLEKRIYWQYARSVKRESQNEFRVVDG